MSINKENMNQNKNRNKPQLVIVKEHQKLNYIEYIISKSSNTSSNTSVREMETLISNFIDYTCEQRLLEAEKCRILIKEKQPENYDKIIYAANGLIYNYDLIIN
jgi:hypothetical protein